MKIMINRKIRVLYFEKHPEVRLCVTELETLCGVGAAWERFRAAGIDDTAIKDILAQAKYVELSLNCSGRRKVETVAAEQMNCLGVGAAWAVIDTVTREAHLPSKAVSQVISQMDGDGLSAKEIGDQFIAWCHEA
jgi:hypothetical protein